MQPVQRALVTPTPPGLRLFASTALAATAADVALLVTGFERRSSWFLAGCLVAAVILATHAVGFGCRVIRRAGWPPRAQVIVAEAVLLAALALPFAGGFLLNGGRGYNELVAWGIAWWLSVGLVIVGIIALCLAERPGTLRRSWAALCASSFGVIAVVALVGVAVNLATPKHPRPPDSGNDSLGQFTTAASAAPIVLWRKV